MKQINGIKIVLNSQEYFMLNGMLTKTTHLSNKDGKKFVLKIVDNNGLIAHRDILPKLDTKRTKRLILPTLIEIGTLGGNSWVLLESLEGDDYNGRWNEHLPEIAGGRSITKEKVNIFLDLVEDLIGFDTQAFINTEIRIMDSAQVSTQFNLWLQQALGFSLVSQNHVDKARSIIADFLTSLDTKLYISNEDFQFRNFIDLPDEKVGVIDWESCRLSNFELEHMISYQWILMWNNPLWQRELLKQSVGRFQINKAKYKAVMLISSLHQAMAIWPGSEKLRQIQIDYFINSLDDNYIDYVFNA